MPKCTCKKGVAKKCSHCRPKKTGTGIKSISRKLKRNPTNVRNISEPIKRTTNVRNISRPMRTTKKK